MSADKQSWISGQFIVSPSAGVVFQANGKAIQMHSGMEVEASLCGTHLVKGRIGKRDDGLYLLGRMPMFAIPLSFLNEAHGRITLSPTSSQKSA